MAANARSFRFNRLIASFAVPIAACLVVLALPVVAQAATLYVSTLGSDTAGAGTLGNPFATVQKAMNVAIPGSVVSVGPGTYNGDVSMTAGVSLSGAGASLTILRGSGTKAVITANGVGLEVTISGFTITGGGGAGNGGGIYCSSSSPTISHNTVIANSALYGGGIYCINSSPVVMGNIIAANSASASGGGIYCSSSSPTIADNTFAGNVAATHGGAIDCASSSPLSITGNTVAGNTAGSNGGGIYCTLCNAGPGGITDNAITANNAASGGGIYCTSSARPIERNVIAGNRATSGGAVYCNTCSPPITNDVITGNGANSGGGVYLSTSSSAITNDTIANNTALGGGGGVDCATGTPSITNCIVWGNGSDLVGCSATYSDVSVGGSGTGNIPYDPGFVAAGSGDYHLSVGSPCLDDASRTVAPATDKDGIVRPWGPGVDMGAYEFFVPTFQTATTLSGSPSSVKFKGTLRLTGTVWPSSTPGSVTITKSRLVGKKWRSAGTAKVGLSGGKFSYSFKPAYKGSWKFVTTYSGAVVGPTTYLGSKSKVKSVKVK